ncbi:aldose epimerase family protein [Arenibacter sp. M-2]|uniref:aldose epimerase family protein n=1 Tax=unclassified Arenibacter TaxID=2615047 RepID=UPI000D751EFB|nr:MULTISPECIES: aldose epimerase family protein [unclassified Arenibacter]MDL5514542.1 aldose epimerase family protein [Arenibacter sp. M-2]PXX28240.1 aldose 1-epimerase [Arenibacter sp. ARW7G5Y1]
MNQVTIKNSFITLTVLDYGAIIQKMVLKNKEGVDTNVVVGLEEPDKYLNDNKSLGACIGRYAGRISKGGFKINNIDYPIFSKDGVHLHGGQKGFGKRYWTIEQVHDGDNPFVKLGYLSKDMEEGYPGNLKATVTYKLVGSSLFIIHEATTDKATPVNLTNHSYFNLDGAETIDHWDLRLSCSQYLETDAKLLPTGKLISVNNSKYDFLEMKKIGQVRLDTPFVMDSGQEKGTVLASDRSGLSMEVITDQPGVVVYTPTAFAAICFETQNYPDAPNQPHFPNSILQPGETYHNGSEFRFSFVN